jgi:hypothetical protein
MALLDANLVPSAQVDASLNGVDVLAGSTVGYCAPEHDPAVRDRR